MTHQRIQGKVTDSITNATLQGVNVADDGVFVQVTTSLGNFDIIKDDPFTMNLTFSLLGYTPQTISFSSQPVFDAPVNQIKLVAVVPPPEPTTFDVVGVISDSITDVPIQGAVVTFAGLTSISGGNGSYFFNIDVTTSGDLIVTKEGYNTDTRFVVANVSPLLELNINIDPIVAPPPTVEVHFIRGIVMDVVTELPLANVTVIGPFETQVTDAEGGFSFSQDVGWQGDFTFAKIGYEDNMVFFESNIASDNIFVDVFIVQTEPPPEEPPPEEPLPGFWENIKQLLIDALASIGFTISSAIINAIQDVFLFITGTQITETEAVGWLAHAPGLNALHKLMFGANLDGTPDEEITTSEAVELALIMIPMPTALIAKIGGTVFVRTGVAGGAKVTSKIIDVEFTIIAEGVTKFNLLKMLNTFAATILRQKIVQLLGAIALLIFAVAEIPQLLLMRKFAYHQSLEQAGDDPKSVSFNLKRLEDVFDNLLFEINTAVRNNEIVQSALIIIDMETVTEEYTKFIDTKQKVLVDTETVELITLNKDVMVNQVERLKTKFAEAIQIEKDKIVVPPTEEPPPVIPPEEEPVIPPEEEEPTTPQQLVEFELQKVGFIPNAWKVTIRAIDADTGETIFAGVKIDDTWINRYTPTVVYLQPEATYHILVRKEGFTDGEVDLTTDPLPTT